jgi:ribonuclease P protein component
MNNMPSKYPQRFRFGANRRLRNNTDFKRVLAARRYAADSLLVVYVCLTDLGYSRLGIAVGRKYGGAVARNRFKRVLREAFRLSQHELPQDYDIVVMPRITGKPPGKATRRSGKPACPAIKSKISGNYTTENCRRSLIRLCQKLHPQ